jgi:hypothetical protein
MRPGGATRLPSREPRRSLHPPPGRRYLRGQWPWLPAVPFSRKTTAARVAPAARRRCARRVFTAAPQRTGTANVRPQQSGLEHVSADSRPWSAICVDVLLEGEKLEPQRSRTLISQPRGESGPLVEWAGALRTFQRAPGALLLERALLPLNARWPRPGCGTPRRGLRDGHDAGEKKRRCGAWQQSLTHRSFWRRRTETCGADEYSRPYPPLPRIADPVAETTAKCGRRAIFAG